MKKLMMVIFALFSVQTYSASMDIKAGQLGLKFENVTGDKELEITSIRPIVECSTTYYTFFGDVHTVTNSSELKAVHYPDSLHVGTTGISYVQLNISAGNQVFAPKKTFYRDQSCQFGIKFKALVLNESSGDEIMNGEVNAMLFKTARENTDIITEMASRKVLKFKVQTASDGQIEFDLGELGVFKLN